MVVKRPREKQLGITHTYYIKKMTDTPEARQPFVPRLGLFLYRNRPDLETTYQPDMILLSHLTDTLKTKHISKKGWFASILPCPNYSL